MDVSACAISYFGNMNMVTRNIQPIDGADVLAVLDRRLAELAARRDEITAEILQLERTSSSSRAPQSGKAELLLQGEEFAPEPATALTRLQALHAERAVIDQALLIGRNRQTRLQMDREAEIWAAHFHEIAKIEKRRLLLALELQAHNRKREDLRDKIAAAGGARYLPTDNFEMLGVGDLADEVLEAGMRLVADGIVTEAEIARGRRG